MIKFRAYKYTRGQKVILSVLACITIVASALWLTVRSGHLRPNSPEPDKTTDSALVERIRTFENGIKSYNASQTIDSESYTSDHLPLKTFLFDPNTIDSADMVSLGFKPWMAHNLIRYRAKGGRICAPQSLKRIYGIDTALVDRLLPYISIDSAALGLHRPATDSTSLPDSLRYPKKTFFAFDLNRADTTLLASLPGIGPARATMIVRYRNMLGGYATPAQLYEIEQIPDSIISPLMAYATADTALLRRINVNKSGIKRLRRHPYINYYQARAIYDLRWDSRHKGTLAPDDLQDITEFTPEELRRLLPYLSFE